MRFARLDTDLAALEQALTSGLSVVLSLRGPFRAALSLPDGDLSSLEGAERSEFFPWREFDTARRLFAGQPRDVLAAVGLRLAHGPLVLAALEFRAGPPRLRRVRAGQGVLELRRALVSIPPEDLQGPTVEVALATEDEHGALGWLVADGTPRRTFWPAFPSRFGLSFGHGLGEARFFEILEDIDH